MLLPWSHMRLRCCRWCTMNVSECWHKILTHVFALLGAQNCSRVSYIQKISGWRGLWFRVWQKKGVHKSDTTFEWFSIWSKFSHWWHTNATVPIEITLTLGCLPPLIRMVFSCISLSRRRWRNFAWRKRLWVLQLMVLEIFGSVERHWSRNTVMTPFFHHPIPSSPWNAFLAHILVGACKEGEQYIKAYDGEVDTKWTRRNIQKFITSLWGTASLWD